MPNLTGRWAPRWIAPVTLILTWAVLAALVAVSGPGAVRAKASTWPVAAQADDRLTLWPDSPPTARRGESYDARILATGGIKPHTFEADERLPDGLELARDGMISGTTAPGAQSGSFEVTVTDAEGATDTAEFAIQVTDPDIRVRPDRLQKATVGQDYTEEFHATGGTGQHTFRVTDGRLPQGLQLADTGRLSGQPTTEERRTFTVTATDGNGFTGSRSYTLETTVEPIIVGPRFLPGGKLGRSYPRAQMLARGGTDPYTFEVTDGTLPPGLALAPNGQLSGLPEHGGVYNVTITASDANGRTASRDYWIEIKAKNIHLQSGIREGKAGVRYKHQFKALETSEKVEYTLADGKLPAGLKLSPTGVLSGKPIRSGLYQFTIRGVDAKGAADEEDYDLPIRPTAIHIQPAKLKPGTTGKPYRTRLTATGGVSGPYTYRIIKGKLPRGLKLTPRGTLAGKPAKPGRHRFTVQVTDKHKNTDTARYTLRITRP